MTDQLYEIIRENVSLPGYDKLFPDYPNRLKAWMEKISFSVDNVTSKDIDAPNERITCNATVHMKASGADQEQEGSADYQVAADLSTRKPIVSAAFGIASSNLSQLLMSVAAPEVDKIKNQQEADDAKKSQIFEQQWDQSHAQERATRRAAIAVMYPKPGYSDSEREEVFQIKDTSGKCTMLVNSGKYIESTPICDRVRKLENKIREQGLCLTESDSAFHCAEGPPMGGHLGDFSNDERTIMAQADDLNDKCRGGNTGVDAIIESNCNQRDAVNAKLKSEDNICWGPEDAIGSDQHWMRCVDF